MASVERENYGINTVAVVGSYVPRQCGIATFSNDLRNAMAEELDDRNVAVIALDDEQFGYDYPREVRFEIPQHQLAEYRSAADLLNVEQFDLCVLQHEYGLYGGRDGAHVLDFTRRLRMPLVTTFHTVLAEPSAGQRAVLRELGRVSDRVVVMSQLATKLLTDVYHIPADKIAVIPHGIPDVGFVDPSFFKDGFGVEGRKVVLTFGLLSPGKGVETAIRALPEVVARHPELTYIILGATHPHVARTEGNAYRHSLERLVDELGLRDHVQFHSRFVSNKELRSYLGAADLYVVPYPNKAQITSGTLAYAVGAGKAVISTPFWHAEELLADGRGRLFPFHDSKVLAQHLNELLDNETERNAIRKRAYMHGRPMIWREVGRAYLQLGAECVKARGTHPRPVMFMTRDEADARAIPDLTFSHVRRLTDYTGILQHATYAVPNRHEGYCVDDNCRALLACLLHHEQTRDASVLGLMDVYLSFIHHAFNPHTRRFRNFMSFDRRWLEESGSEDSHARTLWALGVATALAPDESNRALAMRLFHDGLPAVSEFTAPRSFAFALLGIDGYLRAYSGDTPVRRMRAELAQRVFDGFNCCRDADGVCNPDWPWCEDVVTYDNARIVEALITTGKALGRDDMLQQGLASLKWLVDVQIVEHGRVSLIGNNGWLRKDGARARFDQQAIECMAMVDACAAALRATDADVWVEHARKFMEWFVGNNDTHSMLYDYKTGGCRDGLSTGGPNLNQGAESTLAWVLSHLSYSAMLQHRAVVAARPAVAADGDAPPQRVVPHDGVAKTNGEVAVA